MNPIILLIAILFYFVLLFSVACFFEKESSLTQKIARHPISYSLSLGVYCTSWTYYGSVGSAAKSGLAFLAIYLGPTIMICLWWFLLRRLVIIKDKYRITSIADFLSARYNKSQALAALVSFMALLGSMPYIALQLDAVKSTFLLMGKTSGVENSWIIDHIGSVIVLLMTFFAIMFGARKLDPTERHQGMMMAIAFESVIKLVAFSACGLLATYYLVHDHSGNFLTTLVNSPTTASVFRISNNANGYITWSTLMILSMSAIMFLPRQFHVAVVENTSPRNILPAMWQFPLYMFLINIFVVPIALHGILAGIPVSSADSYVLGIPLLHGNAGLALFVFIGGFSAAMSMIVVASMTLSTMAVNHLLLPVFTVFRVLSGMRRYLLVWRWICILFILVVGYWFQVELSSSYALVNMGLISFAAVLQFAPVALGALLWPAGNIKGAICGLTAGFCIWLYTLLIPALIKSGLIATTLLTDGPWKIRFLRPEHLFGLDALPALSHTVFWSLLFNVGFFITVSILSKQSEQERNFALDFTSTTQRKPAFSPQYNEDQSVDLAEKKAAVSLVLRDYFPPEKCQNVINAKLAEMPFQERKNISILEFAEFHRNVEIVLAGSIGSAMANRALNRENVFSAEEKKRLAKAYAEILSRINVSPQVLTEKINFYREREQLLLSHGQELEQRIREKEQEIKARIKVEGALKEAEYQYRSIFDNALEGIFQTSAEGKLFAVNPAMASIFGFSSPQTMIEEVGDINTLFHNDPALQNTFFPQLGSGKNVENYQCRIQNLLEKKEIWININARPILDNQGKLKGIEGILDDITQRKTAEEKLNRYHEQLEETVRLRTAEVLDNQAFLQEILEGIRAAVIVINKETVAVLDCNSIAEELIGYDKQRLIADKKLLVKTNILQQKSDGKLLDSEITIEHQSGELIPVLRNVLPVVFKGQQAQALIVFDISERKALERQVNMAQKLQSIGQLAAGIAHEINTPMQFIGTNMEFLEEASQGMAIISQTIREIIETSPQEISERLQSTLDEADWEYLMEEVPAAIEQSKSGINRVTSIVRAMKEFSHASPKEKELIVVNSIIETTILLSRNEWKYVSDLTTDLVADLPAIPCFADELGQVILNIIVNAAHAIGEKLQDTTDSEKGEIHISTKALESFVEIRISDTGSGIPAKFRDRIFDPFFTTKEVGKGTGQGLAISHDIIVGKHGGTFTFETEEGRGTTFIICLPC